MIDLARNKIIFNDAQYEIREWVVWFMTPWGLIPRREDAVQRAANNDVDPAVVVVPVPVALGDGDIYEIFVRV